MKRIKTVLFLMGLTLFAACSSEDDAPQIPDQYTTATALLEDVGFNGYAIITKDGRDLVRQGFGFANTNTGMPQSHDLPYRIGSVTKTLTAAAMVQLKRDGFISGFDQTLDAFDTDFPNGDQITIAQLLSHQSGIPEYQHLVEQAYEQGENLDQDDVYGLINDLITENGLNFTPGAAKQYTNSNFYIAGMLIQELSGMGYHSYVQEKILDPLGMATTFKGSDIIDRNTHAEGYFNGHPNSSYPISIPFSAGDFSSTPQDMETWATAVGTNWFSEAEKTTIFVEDVPSGFVDFGLGWFTTQEGNTTLYWHGGDINGYWSMIGFVPAYNATIVLLSNQEDPKGAQRNTIIQQLLTQEFIN